MMSRTLSAYLVAGCFVPIVAEMPSGEARDFAYTFYGQNIAEGVAPGTMAAGYFILTDSTAHRVHRYQEDEGPSEELSEYEWNWSDTVSFQNNLMQIDDSLSDSVPYARIQASFATISGPVSSEIANRGEYTLGTVGFANRFQTPLDMTISSYEMFNFPIGRDLRVSPRLPQLFDAGIKQMQGYEPGSTSRELLLLNLPTSRIDVRDVFKNPKSLEIDDTAPPGTMQAFFRPHIHVGPANGGTDIPIVIEDLVRMYEVEYFNWKQTIRFDPFVTKIELDTDGNPRTREDRQRILGPISIIDPVLNYPQNHFVTTNETGRESVFVLEPGETSDDLPGYYERSEAGGEDVWQYSQVVFQDTPSLSAKFNTNPAINWTYFETRLIGVTSDGKEKDTGIGFRWRSNSVHDSEGVIVDGVVQFDGYMKTIDREGIPPIIGGGIELIEVFYVPESTGLSLGLTAISVLAVGGGFRQKRVASPRKS